MNGEFIGDEFEEKRLHIEICQNLVRHCSCLLPVDSREIKKARQGKQQVQPELDVSGDGCSIQNTLQTDSTEDTETAEVRL